MPPYSQVEFLADRNAGETVYFIACTTALSCNISKLFCRKKKKKVTFQGELGECYAYVFLDDMLIFMPCTCVPY